MSQQGMTRRDFVKASTAMATGAAATAESVKQAGLTRPAPAVGQGKTKRPNILFLFSDQHNARCLGVAGHPDVKTPNLDALAGQGTRFSHAFCQNPICTPSRTSYLSGLYPHNHGHYGNGGPQPFPLLSLFSHAKAHGYRTAAFGKIHTPIDWIEPHLDVESDLMKPGSGGYKEYLDKRGLGNLRDDGTFPESRALKQPGQPLDSRPARLPFEHIIDRYFTERLMEFLRTQPADQPFCAWLTVPHPHEVYAPAKEFWDMYDEAKVTLPPNADDPLEDHSPQARQMLRQRSPQWPKWLFEPKDWEHGRRRVLHGYLACVTMMDACMGLALRELKSLGMEEDTIVVYAADHGDFAGEHGIIEKAPGLAFDSITRVPMMWRWPGRIPSGKVCDELVESVDFLPTVCSLAGLPVPTQCDGYDITSLLRGDSKPVRQAAFTENPWGKCIRTKDWKLVHYPRQMYTGLKEDVGELYDMLSDPWQLKNLYHDPAQQDRVAEMRRNLMDWLITTSHPLTMNPSAGSFAPEHEGRRGEAAQTIGLGEDARQPWRAIQRAADHKSWNYL